MRLLRQFGIVILAAMLAWACATSARLSAARVQHPIPPAIERLELDTCFMAPTVMGCWPTPDPNIRHWVTVFSMADEQTVATGTVFTERAWQAFGIWRERLIRAYCQGRDVLQAANGEKPDPAQICQESK